MTEEYTYTVRIRGDEAARDAETIRSMVVSQLVQAETQLARAVAQTLEQISSQTRRLSYNKTRLQEVSRELDGIVEAYRKMSRSIGAESGDVFDPLVNDAREAYDEIAGHSVFSELYYALKQYYVRIGQISRGVFEPLEESAEKSSQAAIEQIVGVINKAGKMQWPGGTTLGGVSLGGKYTSLEQVNKYNQGMLTMQEMFPGMESGLRSMGMQLVNINETTGAGAGFMEQFTDQLNAATLQYFGVRRLGYGLEQFGGQLAASGQRNIQILGDWMKQYAEFNGYATRAAAAMEMDAEMQGHLEEAVLGNIEAMKLFTPEETIEGLRVWAAGTGAVIQTQEDLQDIMLQTRDIQILAALGNDQLAESMLYVGSGLAEFGLGMDDVKRVSALYNFVAAKTFAEVSDVGNAFKLVGPLAKASGISIEETAAAIGLLSDENIKGTMAGRAFRQMLIQLAKPTDAHTEAMNKALGLSEELGQSWKDIVFPEGQFVGLADYIDILAAATENLTQEQRNALLATIATANELPALISLVSSQTEARKEGINILRAWIKWSQGIVDDETRAFARMMEETRGIQIDETTNMYSLWAEQSQLFIDSEQARMNQIENRWHAMQVSLGRIVLEEGAPVLDMLIEQLEAIVKFAAEHPGLVTGLMVGAATELILGSLIRTAGQLAGVVANYLILRGAFAGFGGAVGTFTTAVNQFALSVQADKVPSTDDAGGVGALGLVAILKKLFLVGAVIFGTDQPSAQQRVYEDMLETLREIGVSTEQWEKILSEAQWEQIPGAGYGRERRLMTDLDGKRIELDVQGVLELLEAAQMLTDEQQAFLEQLRTASPTVDVAAELADLPPELQDLLGGGESTWTIYPEIAMGFTAEEMTALDLYQSMLDDIDEITAKHKKAIGDLERKFDRQAEDDLAKYLRRREDAILKAQQKEEVAYEKHLAKLVKLERDAQQRIERAKLKLQHSIEDLRAKAAREEAEAVADAHKDEEQETAEYLKTMQRMEEDHRDKLLDLAIKRDAYGIIREMRDYSKDRRRETEDYNDRMKQLKSKGKERIEEIRKQTKIREDDLRKAHRRELKQIADQLALKLKQEVENYLAEQKQRDKALARTLTDYETNYDRQQDDRLDAFNEAKGDLQDKFNSEKQIIQTEMATQLGILLGYYNDDVANHAAYLQQKLDDMYWFLEQYSHMWNSMPGTDPIGPPPQPPYNPSPPSEPPAVAPPYGGVYPLSVPLLPINGDTRLSGPVTIKGDLKATVHIDGVAPEGTEEDVRSSLRDLFDRAVRDLEVTYD